MARTTREDGDNLLSSSDESEALGKELLVRASQTQKAWRGLTAYSERGSRWKSVKVFTFDKNLPVQEGRLLRHRIQVSRLHLFGSLPARWMIACSLTIGQ